MLHCIDRPHFIYQLMEVWIVSTFGLLGILLCVHSFTGFHVSMFSFFWV